MTQAATARAARAGYDATGYPANRLPAQPGYGRHRLHRRTATRPGFIERGYDGSPIRRPGTGSDTMPGLRAGRAREPAGYRAAATARRADYPSSGATGCDAPAASRRRHRRPRGRRPQADGPAPHGEPARPWPPADVPATATDRRAGDYGRGGYDDVDLDDEIGAEKPRRKRPVRSYAGHRPADAGAVVGVGSAATTYGKVRTSARRDYTGTGTGYRRRSTVANGDSATAIAQTLYKDGVVKSAKAFVNAADADPDSAKIQVGTYTLHKQMSAKNALAMLLADGRRRQPAQRLRLQGRRSPRARSRSTSTPTLSPRRPASRSATSSTAAKDPVALGVDPSWFTRASATTAAQVGSSPIEGFLFPAPTASSRARPPSRHAQRHGHRVQHRWSARRPRTSCDRAEQARRSRRTRR